MGARKAVLRLADGGVFFGEGLGASTRRVGELVFNTSMQGYQEALTDPSYGGQVLTMSYPLIGNYGVNNVDFESPRIWAEGFVVREASESFFHREGARNLDSFLAKYGVPGICGVDTRALVKRIRKHGVLPCSLEVFEGAEKGGDASFEYSSVNFVEKASSKNVERFIPEKAEKMVVVLDLGAKRSIVKELNKRNIGVVSVPWNSTAKEMLAFEPDGILVSNGPGDPAILTNVHSAIRELAGLPMFGICLGHQCIAHAFGGSTSKLKFGHRGSNHPVYDSEKGRVFITTQNHGFAVERVPDEFVVTQVELNDKTVERMRHSSKPIFSVQYHPEASPGPHDACFLFDHFLKAL
ncbi:MAG: glutamine-hydrolyzing carbamoyl-phosphate synthase small subunit [Candidatus ainarchaeum sp.]|nr:glutamine-hydrolyzing carbamoyl-phosphate synthase small subunit [Candidatus ainarchaeum sp.]MDD5096384.1 glutamine-hydrolyzing carbamoyl-phosphate synthase small subunit [Candidatus ainarchaeum sp.]